LGSPTLLLLKLFKHIKIGEPNINYARIALNPTYSVRKGIEMDTPSFLFMPQRAFKR